jgi:Flp pilus assembly protein TadD
MSNAVMCSAIERSGFAWGAAESQFRLWSGSLLPREMLEIAPVHWCARRRVCLRLSMPGAAATHCAAQECRSSSRERLILIRFVARLSSRTRWHHRHKATSADYQRHGPTITVSREPDLRRDNFPMRSPVSIRRRTSTASMSRPPIWPYCFLPLLLVSLVSPALSSEPDWIEIRSPHFSVVTDAGEKRGRDAAFHFEQMRAVFGALMVKAKVTLPTPLQIVAFRNTKEMREFAPLFKGKPIQVAGLFMGNADRCFILLDMSVEEPWRVVFHEYAHQLMNGNISGEIQPWFEEGFAEYFSTIKVVGKEAQVGLLSDVDVQILRQSGMMKIVDLFSVRHNSSTYNESGDHRSVFYAESWLVMHYLYDQNLVPKAGAYLDAADQPGVSVEQAIQQGFGTSAGELNKDILRYWATGNWKFFRLPMPAGIESAGYIAKPLAMPDAKAVLADMHLHSPDYQEKAVAEFEEVLKLQPDNPAALRGLGYAYLMKRDFPRAGVYFTKATQHDSNDPRVLYYSGLLAQMEGGQAFGGGATQLALVQKNLEKSIALDPEFADAYSVLAFTYMSEGNNAQALNTMGKAVVLNPGNEQYRFNLAQLYLANQKVDPALAILEQLKNSSNPGVSAKASQSLTQAQAFKQTMLEGQRPGNSIARQPSAEATAASPPIFDPEQTAQKDLPPVRFLKGKVTAVDCSAPPGAVLTVLAGAKTWKLQVKDSGHVVVIGADNFSCAWKDQSVAVNYRATGETNGDVVSVEVQ